MSGFFTMTGPHGGMLIKAVAPMAGAAGTGRPRKDVGIRDLDNGQIGVFTPYDPATIAELKNLGGRWNPSQRHWVIDARDRQRAESILKDKFGTTGGDDEETVTIQVMIGGQAGLPMDTGEITIGSRQLAKRWGRDMPVKLAPGVVVVDGKFPHSGGSRANPRIGEFTGAPVTLEVRDVPKAWAEKVAKEHPRSVVLPWQDVQESQAAAERKPMSPQAGSPKVTPPTRDPRFDAVVTPQIDARATSIYEALGKSPDKAVVFAGRLAEDVNWHSMAAALLPKNDDRAAIPSGLVSSTSQAIGWGTDEAAAVMSSLLRLAGKNDRAALVESKAIADMPEAFAVVEPPPPRAAAADSGTTPAAPNDHMTPEQLEHGIRKDEASLARAQRDLKTLEGGGTVPNLTMEGARRSIEGVTAAIQNKRALLAKFKGEQATPPAPTPAPSAEAPRASDAADAPAAAPVQHAVAVGPRGGRYIAGSEKRDAKGRKIRRYVGKDEPSTGRQAAQDDPRYRRWSEDVRVRGGRDSRLPQAGTEITRYFKGQAVKVVESQDGQFHVHLDGQHAASGRSLTGALSKALGRAVSGYGFMRLGGAQEGPAVKDWGQVARAKNRLMSVADGVAPFGVKTAEHFKDGVRVHVRHGDDHYLIEGDANGQIRETGGKQHLWKVEGNRYVRVDQIGGKGADKAPEPDKAAEQARPEPQVGASVADRIQSDPVGLAGDVQTLDAMTEPELKALDQAIYERGRAMSRAGDYTSEQVSANDAASLAVAKRLSEIANRNATESKADKPAASPEGFTAQSDAKHGVMPATDLAAHLAQFGIHDPVAAKGMVELYDERRGDSAVSANFGPDPETAAPASTFKPGDIVLPFLGEGGDAREVWKRHHGTEPGTWDEKLASGETRQPHLEAMIRRDFKKWWPTATYDAATDTITQPSNTGAAKTTPVKELVTDSQVMGHLKRKVNVGYDALEASDRGKNTFRVERVSKDGTVVIRAMHGRRHGETFKIHPDMGLLAKPKDPRHERLMGAFDAGRWDVGEGGRGDVSALSPAARNALRKMPDADLEALVPEAAQAASATKGRESPHQKQLNKVVSSLTRHAGNLSNFGIKGADLEVRIHPDAIVLADKNTGEQYAAVEHDMPVTEPDAIAAKRAGLANVSNIRHVPTPHFGAEKSRRDWSFVEDGVLVLHDYAFRREAPRAPEGFEAVIFDHNRDEWTAVKSLDLAGLGDDLPRLPLL